MSDTLLYGPDGRPVLFFGEPVYLTASGTHYAHVPSLPEPWQVHVRAASGLWEVFVAGPRPTEWSSVQSSLWSRFTRRNGSLHSALRSVEADYVREGYTPQEVSSEA